LQAKLLRALIGGECLGFEIETARRQRAESISRLQVDKVFRRLGGIQFCLGR
jgi:hypothetical protein